jgi:hypothetical protein
MLVPASCVLMHGSSCLHRLSPPSTIRTGSRRALDQTKWARPRAVGPRYVCTAEGKGPGQRGRNAKAATTALLVSSHLSATFHLTLWLRLRCRSAIARTSNKRATLFEQRRTGAARPLTFLSRLLSIEEAR